MSNQRQFFSERHDLNPVTGVPQVDAMDDELRHGIWKAIEIAAQRIVDGYPLSMDWKYPLAGFAEFHVLRFGPVLSYSPGMANSKLKANLEHFIMTAEWFRVYDLIESFLAYCGRTGHDPNRGAFLAKALAGALTRNNAGYVLVDNQVIPAASAEEAQEISDCLAEAGLPAAQKHLRTAAELMRSEEVMSWRNAVKEAASAVEGLTHLVTGDESSGVSTQVATLTKTMGLHPAVGKQILDFYGWACDVARHNLRNGDAALVDVQHVDARYALSVASSIVNFLKLRYPREAGLC